MAFTSFLLYILLAYVVYYLINIAIDFIRNGSKGKIKGEDSSLIPKADFEDQAEPVQVVEKKNSLLNPELSSNGIHS